MEYASGAVKLLECGTREDATPMKIATTVAMKTPISRAIMFVGRLKSRLYTLENISEMY